MLQEQSTHNPRLDPSCHRSSSCQTLRRGPVIIAFNAVAQIKALRNAVHKDMSNLASMAQQQAARASDAEKRLVRSVSCGVQILQRKERQKLLQALFIAWR